MFNSHARLVKALVESGQTATATVLEATAEPVFWSGDGGGLGAAKIVPWTVALRVVGETEPEFEVRQTLHVSVLTTLAAGYRLQVLYDPNDHTRLVVDPRTEPKNAEEATAGYQAALAEQAQTARQHAVYGQGSAAKVDVAALLEQLDRVKELGLMDEAQYQAKRQELLDLL